MELLLGSLVEFQGVELLQLHLATNVTDLVEPTEPGSFWEKFSFHLTSCLLELLAAENLRETHISISRSHLLFLFFRCLEKGFEEERNKNKDENNRGVTTSQLPQKEMGTMKFLALTSYLLARITLTLMSSFAITIYFQKVNFQALNLLILNFELSSAFLYALCELLEKQTVLFGNNSV